MNRWIAHVVPDAGRVYKVFVRLYRALGGG
jgi:hypothetical protein